VSLVAADTGEFGTLATLEPELALGRAVPFLSRLVKDHAFLSEHIVPILEGAEEADEWYVAHSCEGKDGSYSLEIFVWPPATRTQIHDHSS
jgi:hypothetical protein